MLAPWAGNSSKVTEGFTCSLMEEQPSTPTHIPLPQEGTAQGEPPRVFSSPGLSLESGFPHLNSPFSTVQKPEEIWSGNHVFCLGKGLGK